MKAARIHQWGGNNVVAIEDIEYPQIGPDDVLIQLRAAGVNPVDWKMREGYLREWFSLPLTLGKDGAGDIVAVGANVDTFNVGDAVYGHFGHTFAEFTTAKATDIALKPTTLDYIHAAAIPLAGLTAWRSLIDGATLSTGQKVLIHAAAGGTGSFGIQFAKAKGAFVVGTASLHNEAFVRELGADQFLDYASTRFEEVLQDMDVVFDAVGGDVLERSYGVVKPGGILITLAGQPSREKAAARGITTLTGDFSQPSQAILSEIARLVDSGQVKIHVSCVYPLADVTSALEDIQRGHTQGKLVVQIRD